MFDKGRVKSSLIYRTVVSDIMAAENIIYVISLPLDQGSLFLPSSDR